MLRSGAEGFVEVCAEAVSQGFFKELINPDTLAEAFLEGTLTDIPPVKIQGKGSSGESGYSDRVEAAGGRFYKPAFLYGAKHAAVWGKAGVGAFLGLRDHGSDYISITVKFEETRPVNGFPALGTHKG